MARGDTLGGTSEATTRDGSDEKNSAERDEKNNSYYDVETQLIMCFSI